jgi:hypothetical protein
MIAFDECNRHDEVWLLLPWLATGRLAPAEREMAEEHVRRCKMCEQELAVQHLIDNALNEPDRVTYAPGPSFRKLMDRIEGDSSAGSARTRKPAARPEGPTRRPLAVGSSAVGSLAARLGHVSLWRPPGLAWAASFLLLFGITGMMFTAYRWSQPLYATRSDAPAGNAAILHIALNPSLPIGEVEDLLRAGGARIVEGPRDTGELGVIPIGAIVGAGAGQTSAGSTNKQLRALSARLRTDPRVLWIQPLPDEGAPADPRAPDVQEH